MEGLPLLLLDHVGGLLVIGRVDVHADHGGPQSPEAQGHLTAHAVARSGDLRNIDSFNRLRRTNTALRAFRSTGAKHRQLRKSELPLTTSKERKSSRRRVDFLSLLLK